jgi:single-strand DNA-binding protein
MPTATKASEKKTETPSRGPVVTKIGNLTADPELRFSEKGTPYCRMRLAVSTPVKPGDWAGERKTSYYDVTAFGTLAENATDSLGKGDRVLVTGRGEVRSWTGDDGTDHSEKVILADGLGPDLRWATATIARNASGDRSSSQAPHDDSGYDTDEEPF